MARTIDRGLWEQWRARLLRFESWDGTVGEFCRREGVSQASFCQWRKKLRSRSVNNSDPELDQHRRQMVAWILAEKGVSNTSARVIVSQSYDPGQNGEEATRTFNRFINGGNQGGFGGGGGGGGGFGGGGF